MSKGWAVYVRVFIHSTQGNFPFYDRKFFIANNSIMMNT